MTNHEAAEKIMKDICASKFCNDSCMYGDNICPYDMAKKALEEIQQYREIGTVEEIKDLLVTISEAAEDVDENGISIGFIKDLIELSEYRKVGTVEECRKAVEKQKPIVWL